MLNRVSVLVAASGADWEAAALHDLGAAGPGIVLLKRCVDLPDLLASAMTGQAQVAVVADDLPGVDADSVAHLRRSGVEVVMVTDQAEIERGSRGRLQGLGVGHLVSAAGLAGLPETVAAVGREPSSAVPSRDGPKQVLVPDEPQHRRLLAVWGPTGAPGRTTVAIGLAAQLAARGRQTFLVDADPYGGAVAQHLGVLDEVSGLLAAARIANAGQLDAERLAACAREVVPGLRVLTGLPRADRWAEVRDTAFGQILDLCGQLGDTTVVDAGFCLEEDANATFGSAAPQRNQMTRTALERADEVVAVGSADPVGLGRLARGLISLVEVVPGARLRIVVNRMRPSLGWQQEEVVSMLDDFATPNGIHFLPDDRVACDRALVAGKSLVEIGDSALRRALAPVVDAVTGEPAPARRAGLFRRG